MSEQEMVAIQEVYLKSDASSGNMVVLKEHVDAKRYFMMFVGDAEFAAIAKEKNLVHPARPLTHDLYLGILEKAEVTFHSVEIKEMRENTYYAVVKFRVGETEYEVDSRPSDGVALALNRKIPLLVNSELFRRELTREEIQEYEGLVKAVKF